MSFFRLAGKDFQLDGWLPALQPFITPLQSPPEPAPAEPSLSPTNIRTVGMVAGKEREVQVRAEASNIRLSVAGGSDFIIASGGKTISKAGAGDEHSTPAALSALDYEILQGPALVLALALRGTWCLHASAAVFGTHAFVFLGESGQGKSTLAAWLAGNGDPAWRLLADDILPVTVEPGGLCAWPHFPQLKLPLASQPGPDWPEQTPIETVCLLSAVDRRQAPALEAFSTMDAVQSLLRHTAGTRLFMPELLAAHLAFCASAPAHISMVQIKYPHVKEGLPIVRQLLENLC